MKVFSLIFIIFWSINSNANLIDACIKHLKPRINLEHELVQLEKLSKTPFKDASNLYKLNKDGSVIDGQIEEILSNISISSLKSEEISRGVTKSYKLTISKTISAIWKPEISHKASSANKEVAAYIVDRFLGFGLVPVTVFNYKTFKKGSLQYFVRNYTPQNKLVQETNRTDYFKMVLFDSLIANKDRYNRGNFLMNEDGNLALIDNGFSFHTTYKHQHFDGNINIFLEKPEAIQIYQHLKNLNFNKLKRELQFILDQSEIRSLLARFNDFFEKVEKAKNS